MTKHKTKAKEHTPLSAFMIGLPIGVAAALLALIVSAWIIAKFDVLVTALPTLSAVCLCFGGFVSGFAAGCIHRKRGVVIGLICGMIWLAVVFLGNLLMQNGLQTVTLIKAGICLLLCILGGGFGTACIQRKSKHRYT